MINTLFTKRGEAYLECDGHKLPIVIETIRQAACEPTYFEGYIYDGWRTDSFYKTERWNSMTRAIKDVKFNNPFTTVFWNDGTNTIAKCREGEEYSKEIGLVTCIAMKHLGIKDVIFNNPATIVLWNDGTKTIVKCQGDDEYSEEVGLALCIAKKALGNKPNFNNVFRKWIPEYEDDIPANTQMNMSDYMAKLGTASSLAAEVMTKFKDALHAKKEETAND